MQHCVDNYVALPSRRFVAVAMVQCKRCDKDKDVSAIQGGCDCERDPKPDREDPTVALLKQALQGYGVATNQSVDALRTSVNEQLQAQNVKINRHKAESDERMARL